MSVIAQATSTAPAQLITLGIAILGLAGLIFTALKYNRDDTTSIISQQDTIFNDMKVINDELRITSTQLRSDKNDLQEQIKILMKEIEKLQREIANLRGP